MTTERKYSVQELDALRDIVKNKYLYGCYNPNRNKAGWSRSYKETDMVKSVEEQVRTHMTAGHTAEDLIASEERVAANVSQSGTT